MATENVYEKSKLKIRTSLVGKMKPGKDKATLIFTKAGVDQPTIELTVKNEKVETEHVFANVDDDKENYTLSYKVKYDTETLAGANDYAIWPLNSVIKLVDAEGKPAKKAPFELAFEDKNTGSFEAADDGTCDCKLKYKSKFTVKGRKSITVARAKPGKDKGRAREYEVATLTFKIELPAHPKSIEQYVNTTSANAADTVGHDKEGRYVAIVVACTEEAKARQDDVVFVQLDRQNKTKRTADIPALLDVLELDTKKPDQPKGKVKLGADKKGRFRVDLGYGGGESITISVGSTAACAEDSIKFVNNRKLEYQMSGPTGKSLAVASAEGWLKKVNVEIASYKTKAIDQGTSPAGTYVDPGDGTKICILGTHNTALIDTLFEDTQTPLGFHIALCDMQLDGDGLQKTVSVTCPPGHKVTWPADGTEVVGFSVNFDGQLLKEAMQTGGPAVTGTWAAGAQNGAIPADHIYVNYSNASTRNRLYVKMPDAAKTLLAGAPGATPPVAGVSVDVELEARYGDGPYNGWSTGKHVVIALATDDGARAVPGMNQTVVHEIGHMVNQAGSSTVAGLDVAKDHGKTYTGRGHSGGHCATGVPGRYVKGGGGMGGKSGKCVMFGESAAGRQGEFCKRCAPFVLAEPMDRVT